MFLSSNFYFCFLTGPPSDYFRVSICFLWLLCSSHLKPFFRLCHCCVFVPNYSLLLSHECQRWVCSEYLLLLSGHWVGWSLLNFDNLRSSSSFSMTWPGSLSPSVFNCSSSSASTLSVGFRKGWLYPLQRRQKYRLRKESFIVITLNRIWW